MLAAAALLLPAIIAFGVWFKAQQDTQRSDVERASLDTARKVIALADAELSANRRVLGVMSGSPLLRDRDFDTYAARTERLVNEDPDWNGLVVRDAADGAVLLEIHKPGDTPSAELPPLDPDPATRAEARVLRQGRYCPCVMVSVPVGDAGQQVMTLFLDPRAFQRIVTANAGQTAISGIVDRHGGLVARTVDFESRVGTRAGASVLAAVRKAGDGVYHGTTLEGFETYSAYSTSPESGWSAHIAIGSSPIDSPRIWGNAAYGLAILAALVLAAGLIFYAAYEMRRRRGDEVRFLEMQKAEAVSQFTGTVVHDFRNILAVVDAGLNLIGRQRTKAQMEQTIKEVRDTLGRGERLTNQLLSFVRGDAAEIRTIDLEQLLEGSEELLRRSLGDEIAFSWKVAADARYARANADQLELALLNLAINARDALAGPGRFAIATEKDRDRVVIAVSDNGPGIPPHRREDVFELYVSTKPAGKGTGLGLAQVAGAMRQAEGRVRVTDAPGGGACFLLSLKAGTGPNPGEFVLPTPKPAPKPEPKTKPKTRTKSPKPKPEPKAKPKSPKPRKAPATKAAPKGKTAAKKTPPKRK